MTQRFRIPGASPANLPTLIGAVEATEEAGGSPCELCGHDVNNGPSVTFGLDREDYILTNPADLSKAHLVGVEAHSRCLPPEIVAEIEALCA